MLSVCSLQVVFLVLLASCFILSSAHPNVVHLSVSLPFCASLSPSNTTMLNRSSLSLVSSVQDSEILNN